MLIRVEADVRTRTHHEAIRGRLQVTTFNRGLIEQLDAWIVSIVSIIDIHRPMIVLIFQQIEIIRFVTTQINTVVETFFLFAVVYYKLGIGSRWIGICLIPIIRGIGIGRYAAGIGGIRNRRRLHERPAVACIRWPGSGWR